MSNDEERVYTCILYEDIDIEEAPIWLIAHAALNESEHGLMLIDEIVEDMVLECPERFGAPVYHPKTGKMIIPRNTRATLRSNMSTSPDFAPVVKVGRSWAWSLTGSIDGVPRDDKKVARRVAKELASEHKQAHASRRRAARGAERNAVASTSTNPHLISPYAGRPATRGHPQPVPQPIVAGPLPADNFWVEVPHLSFLYPDAPPPQPQFPWK